MGFELVVEMKTGAKDLRQRWQEEINLHGFSIEILPTFDAVTWQGGFLPIKLIAMPDKYLLNRLLTLTAQIVIMVQFQSNLSPDQVPRSTPLST